MVKYKLMRCSRYIQHPYLIYYKRPFVFGKSPYGRYASNNFGFAGKRVTNKIKAEGVKRIICIGGSTTEMAFGDSPNNTYPHFVEKELGEGFEVINSGVAGWTTVEMLINLELRLLDFNPDIIVIYAGFNDMRRCGMVADFESDYSHARFNMGLDENANDKSILDFVMGKDVQYVEKAPEIAIQTFKRNIMTMCHIAEGNGIIPIVVRMNLKPGNKYTEGFNEAVCRCMEAIKGKVPNFLEVYNLKSSDFMDGCHFNLSGMQKISKAVAECIQCQKSHI